MKCQILLRIEESTGDTPLPQDVKEEVQHVLEGLELGYIDQVLGKRLRFKLRDVELRVIEKGT